MEEPLGDLGRGPDAFDSRVLWTGADRTCAVLVETLSAAW